MGEVTKKKNGCLVGCLSVLGLFVVAIVIIGIVIAIKGESIIMGVLDQAKVGVVALMTEDHSDAEKQEVADTFSRMVDDIKQEGLKPGIQKYQNPIVELQTMIEDKRITRQESKRWLQLYMQSVGNLEGAMKAAQEMVAEMPATLENSGEEVKQ